ncbi:hypothetical protein SAMN04487831_102350 [Pseudobutyrivibrio sp. UC1225]|uniref:nickel pincer cofactor biosynthesis protein LarB n=1 Tax=Pseudobutyrivibrio sp. UC1225 TaxID=1798185 RepID=UPI0008F36C33|nr:nickel pincer cofactor biosynthesis protein LarB [Pseudobutyrivibrio sp. UC1225]SFN66659.1 hypothetical protein SAMN04487831_102350 [Pseudobutyrivibrio sp. UC1225]
MTIDEILSGFENGQFSKEDVKKLLTPDGTEDMGFARLDIGRQQRQGFPEVVFCSGKKDEYLLEILKKLYELNGEVLGTRASKEQYEFLKKELPMLQFDEESGILKIEKEDKKHIGKVVVCTAGTADIPVAKEAVEVASFMGANVVSLFDVGVSGIHRLFNNMGVFDDASCVITVAGMEGALASIVAGLVKCPVIATPTSIGYGASFNGLSALLTMLNSCANGIATVNIDNGYGAGVLASQINRQTYENKPLQ